MSAPKNFQVLHLKAAEWFDKRHYLFASYIFIVIGFRQFAGTINNACESSNNAILSERCLVIFDFCCEGNSYIYQQFASKKA